MSRGAIQQHPAAGRLRLPSLTAGEAQVLGTLLLLGLAVRLVALRQPALPVDLNNWGAWALRVTSLGPWRFYQGNSFADIGPAYALLLGLLGLIARPGTPAASVIFRLPAVFCDLAIGAVIFLTVLRVWTGDGDAVSHRVAVASVAGAAWLLNPAVIFLSAVWGQIESVYALFLLLSVLAVEASPTASLLCYVIAVLIEPRTLELAPLVIIALIARHGLRPLLRPAIAAVVIWCAFTIPFFGWNVLGGPLGVLYASNIAYPDVALNALNIWAAGGSFRSDLVAIVPGVTPFAVGLLLFGLGIWYGIVLLQEQLQRRTDFVLLGSLMGAYLLFLPYETLTREHDRWLLPVLPFLLIFAFVSLRRTVTGRRFTAAPMILYALLSLFLLLVLYRVYEEGLYTPAPVPPALGIYATIAASAAVWAVLSAWAFWGVVVLMPWWLPAGLFRGRGPDEATDETVFADPVAYDG